MRERQKIIRHGICGEAIRMHAASKAASGAKQQNGKKAARPAHVPGALSAHISHCYITVLTASSMPSGGYLCFFAQPLDKAAQSGKRQRAMINRADARRKKNTCRRYRKQAAQCTTHAGSHSAQSSKMAAERQGGAVQEKSLRRNKPRKQVAKKMRAFALLRTRTYVLDSFFTSGAFSWASFP